MFLILVGFSTSSVAQEAASPCWDVNDPLGGWRSISIDTKQTTWSNVSVSADGKTILFDMLGDIFVLPREGGEARALTQDIAWNFQPRFSPDGTQIAFVSERHDCRH